VDLLRQGITPEKIALSIALGAVLGIFPVLGVDYHPLRSRSLCFASQFASHPGSEFPHLPLQLILFLPFLQAVAGSPELRA
jgi:hypothetical protein